MVLTVDSADWRRHVEGISHAVPGLVPVVKGNGYGFGRAALAPVAAELSDTIAVGTVHELDGLPSDVTRVVLTPTLAAPDDDAPILTVGSPEHVAALAGWRGRVLVKLGSTMRRFGRGPELIDTARAAGLDVVGVSIHPALAGDDAAHRAEIEAWLPRVDPEHAVWLSHLTPAEYQRLPQSHRYRLRLGTLLWHGDKSMLHLDADVLDTRRVTTGDHVGYRLDAVPGEGTLLVIGAGTAHGVHPLEGGRSPFHFARHRLPLVEPPHMHVSMAFVPIGLPCPTVGETVDVQRPLTTTLVDDVRWR